MTVRPNPASGQFTVSSSFSEAGKEMPEMFDMSGILVLLRTFYVSSGNSLSITSNDGAAAEGLNTLKISRGDETALGRVLIII
jgi:hypothetical protein